MIGTKVAGRAVAGALLIVAAGAASGRGQQDGASLFTKPTPQHEVLKQQEGVWDATMKIFMGGPDAPPQVSKAVETNRMLGGLWVLSEFQGEFAGQPFQGHGAIGYDTEKKKYVGSWVDNATSKLMLLEGTYDDASKTLTLVTEAVSPATGKAVKERHVHEYKDDDNRLLRMLQPGPDGKDIVVMEVSYKRRRS